MRETILGACLLGGVLASGGCVTPWTTRLPTVEPPHPVIERRSYELHDPFPERDAGPDMKVRPRGFIQERAEPRRSLEGRAMLGLDVHSLPPIPIPPPSAWAYPAAVPE